MADAYAHAGVSPVPSSASFFNDDAIAAGAAFLAAAANNNNNNGIMDDLSFFASTSAPFVSAYLYASSSASPSDAASFASLSASASGVDDAHHQHNAVPPASAAPPPILDTWRVPPSLFTVFVSFYAAVFFCGLVGNTFVVAAIVLNKSFRTATDWLISSLAIADLLILVFCLPSTLLNNLLTEWQLGSWGCKLSVWVNSTTSCASIFTLVGVTGDRYLAICHPLRQLKMKNSLLHWYILGIWLLSALMASPNLWVYRQILYDLISGQQLEPPLLDLGHNTNTNNNFITNNNNNRLLVARLCVDTSNNIWLFIVINLLIAFLVPIVVICVLYALIFRAVSRHTRKKLAVDNGARIRDERVKLRIAQMMFTVIVVFVLCWTPLYALYCYFFMAEDRDSMFFQFASSVLRPIFQWLSLLSSSLNPLIYIAFSQKYRRAFHSLLLFPCRRRYKEFKQATRSTFRRSSCFSEKPSTAQLFSFQLGTNNYAMRAGGEENVCANYMFSNNHSSINSTSNNMHRRSADTAIAQVLATERRQQQQQQQLRQKVSFTTTAVATGCAAQQQQQTPAMTTPSRRKMSEQLVPTHHHQRHPQQLEQEQQQLLHQRRHNWRPSVATPLPLPASCSTASVPSTCFTSLLTTGSCDFGVSGDDNSGSRGGGGGAGSVSGNGVVPNLLRRVALENSQRKRWWQQRQQMMSLGGGPQHNNDATDDDGACRRGTATSVGNGIGADNDMAMAGGNKRWTHGGGGAERRRRRWRDAMTASPEHRQLACDGGSEEGVDGDAAGVTQQLRAASASSRTRSADPLLRATGSSEQLQQSLENDDDDEELLQRSPTAHQVNNAVTRAWR